MPAPAGRPHLPAFVSATALALLAPVEPAAAETRGEIKQVIYQGIPRYDPTAYEKAQAEKAARAVPKNSPAPIPETKSATPVPVAAAPATEKILELPKVTVRSNERPLKRLPRIDAPAKPLKELPSEPFESAAGRDARLVKNHLTSLQQKLIPLFGGSVVAEARAAEYRHQKAAQMNELAAALEIQAALGRDPEEMKKLRAEYLKLYYSGPK